MLRFSNFIKEELWQHISSLVTKQDEDDTKKKKKKKKKNQPGLKFHSGVNFTSPTFNMPLSFEFFILKLQMRTDSNIPFDFLVDAKVVVRSRIN